MVGAEEEEVIQEREKGGWGGITGSYESRTMLELYVISQTLQKIVDVLERIAPYFEERTIQKREEE